VLVLAMIFLAVFSCIAVSMVCLSGNNLQTADNQRHANCALHAAESGLEVMRYWMKQVSVTGTTPEHLVFSAIANSVIADFNDAGITVEPVNYGSGVYIPPITVNGANQQSFTTYLIPLADHETIRMYIIGRHMLEGGNAIFRTILVNYKIGRRANSVFDYGVATRGPLSLSGNIDVDGANLSVESNAYIESLNELLALDITGNSQIGGEVNIVNPSALFTPLKGKAAVGGETGSAGESHIHIGAPETEFPEPNPAYFRPFAVNTFDPNTNTSADNTFENLFIPKNTDPHFSGHVTIRGILYVESPNTLIMTGGVDVTGLIVADGDWEDDSGDNEIYITGNVDSYPVTELSDEPQFADLRNEIGTFIMAPGYKISIGGSFDTIPISGAIAGNGVEFFGDAGGTILGSIINYSEETMSLSGNSDLLFNRSGLDEIPAGFVPQIIVAYDPVSYRELMIQSSPIAN